MLTSVSTRPATAEAKQKLTASQGEGLRQTKRGTHAAPAGLPGRWPAASRPSRCCPPELLHRGRQVTGVVSSTAEIRRRCPPSCLLTFLLSSIALGQVTHAEAWSRRTGQKQEVLWMHIYEFYHGHCSLCVSLGSNPGLSLAYTGLEKYAHLLLCDHRFCAGRIRRLSLIASELQTPSSRVTATALSDRPLPFTGQCCRVRAACLMQIGFIWSPGGDEPWHTRHISIWEDPDKGETNTVDRGVLYIHSSPLTRCHLHMSQENI